MRLTSKLLSVALFAVPALSMASPISITFDKADLGLDYKLTYNKQTENVFVGSLLFSTPSVKTPFTTFCVDLDHFITNGQTYTVNPIQTTTLTSSNVYRIAGDILDAGYKTATDQNHSAALQLAIWKSVYGSQFSVSGVSSTVQNLENSYYSAGLKFSGDAIYLQGTTGCKGQSQITTTPEPASMAVLGIGAIGIFFRRRRN
jgi:hypothetical protein